MRAWRSAVILVLVVLAAAFAWHWLAADPGYVQLRMRDTTIETSVVVLIAALLFAWLLLTIAWRLLRWPFRAWGRSMRRRGRGRGRRHARCICVRRRHHRPTRNGRSSAMEKPARASHGDEAPAPENP